MSDIHEALFRWPHSAPTTVILTGSFDQWSSSINLKKGPNGFEGTVRVPWASRIPYKFIVDGRWMVQENKPTEYDSLGNLNNIYVSPPQPSTHIDIPSPIPRPVPATPSTVPATNGLTVVPTLSKSNSQLGEEVIPPVEATPGVHNSPGHSEPSRALDTEEGTTQYQFQTDATSEPDSTSDTVHHAIESFLDHGVSTVDAAINSRVGVDLCSNHSSLETPLPEAASSEIIVDSDGGNVTQEASLQVISGVSIISENSVAGPGAEAEVTPGQDVETSLVAPNIPIPVNDVDTTTITPDLVVVLDKEPSAAERHAGLATSEAEDSSTHAAVVPALSDSDAPIVGGFSTDANPDAISTPSPSVEVESNTGVPQPTVSADATSESHTHTESASLIDVSTKDNSPSSTPVTVPIPNMEASTPREVVNTTSLPTMAETPETKVSATTTPTTGPSTPPAVAGTTPLSPLTTVPETTQEKANGASTSTDRPALNGNGTHSSPPPFLEKSDKLSSPPTTPKKSMRFPSSSSATSSPTTSPSSSRFGTPSSRKKRHSILGKIKDIFTHHHKDKEGKELAK